nr:phosphatase PAP2 family protein [Bradyrhizobium diazoefficiens]
MGGLGNLTVTGLGSFVGAGADPVYDPLMVQGLEISEQTITHVANAPSAGRTPGELTFSAPGNMALWADWVRASLYLSDYLGDLKWEACDEDRRVTLSYGGSGHFYNVQKPPIECFQHQLPLMRAYMDQRPDRSPEILTQLGFPTPYFVMLLGLQGVPSRYTFELIAITQVLAAHTAMVVKHHLACRRPDRIGAQIMPMIPTPAHASFPSAHATEAFAVAEVLNALVESRSDNYADFEKRQALISKLAERIAVNRTVAGLHFPIDSWAGAILGRAVGQIILSKSGQRVGVQGYRYCANGKLDFFLSEFSKDSNPKYGVEREGCCAVESSNLFEWLWEQASNEFELSR